MFSSIDLFLRKKWSYFYRSLLVTYCLFLCFISDVNEFSWIIYSFVTIAYLILFIIFKRNGYSKLRTLVDFVFIGFMVYGKDLSLAQNYFALIIPLVNAQNNSAERNNKIGYLIVVLFILILQVDDFNFSVSLFKKFEYILLVPIVVIFLIDNFLRFRENIRKLNEKLFEIIDSFYGIGSNRLKTVNIYSKLIKNLNYFNVIKKLEIEYISCFVIKKQEKLILVNSSKPIIEYSFPDEENLINELIKNDIVDGFDVILDKKLHKNVNFLEIKGKSRKYCFLVIYNNDVSSFGLSSIFKSLFLNDFILTPTFKHLARLFEIQREVSHNRYRSLKEVSDKLDYVLKANEVMHFVKGSLNNVKSSLTLSEMIENTATYEKKKFLTDNFVKQRKLAKIDIQHIIDRSNFILAKSKNPFEAHNVVKVKTVELLFHIRKKWEERFWSQKINIGGSISSLFTTYIKTDFDIIDLILINIFSNIFKYSIGKEELEFNIEFNKIRIIFSNLMEFKNKKSQPEISKLIEYYNKKNRIEISKRKSHGFVHLRTYSEALDIESKMSLTDNRYSIIIEFTYCENEDSNI